MKIFHSLGHVIGGTLLIAGTTIGVGMLALPVATGPGGLLPTAIVYFACWVFMLCTGLLLVEVSLWMPKNTSFISMADRLLGPMGRIVFWLVYLFLFVTVMIAHIAGGGEVVRDFVGYEVPHLVTTIVYTVFFVPIVYLGAYSVDRLNLILISGVAICYLGFIALAAPSVQASYLSYVNWPKAWMSLPILFTAFTYQVIIPTLVNYMQRDARKIRLAVIFGSLIPLVVYLLWDVIILGIIPVEGANGLLEAAKLGQNAVAPLAHVVQDGRIYMVGKYFAFFALTTSFVPLSLSFFDFLADGLKWKKDGIHKVGLCFLVFGIPLVIALKFPNIFLVALGYAGGISCALLFGFMPPLMAWVGRYKEKFPRKGYRLPGGKALLGILMVIAILILVSELTQQLW